MRKIDSGYEFTAGLPESPDHGKAKTQDFTNALPSRDGNSGQSPIIRVSVADQVLLLVSLFSGAGFVFVLAPDGVFLQLPTTVSAMHYSCTFPFSLAV